MLQQIRFVTSSVILLNTRLTGNQHFSTIIITQFGYKRKESFYKATRNYFPVHSSVNSNNQNLNAEELRKSFLLCLMKN